jgi:restriction-modification enzyme MmeI-like protein
LGAHYTHDAEMQKIVQPTIVRPWRERIENLSSLAEAGRAQADLMRYVVLDPACGSGNFLYLAYRELRRVERRLHEREAELRRAAGLSDAPRLNVFFPLQNIRGMEIDPFAVALARVTLWMGHRLAVEELDLDERTLPLVDLSGITNADALAQPWPRAHAIIGNPPYHGSQNLRAVLGDQRVKWLSDRFGCGVQDLCVYWFRRAADHMEPGARAGLVGTNSISQNRARGASLNYVVEHGGVITDAVSRQRWPGEAVVNVSIVNWVAQPEAPPTHFSLDGDEVAGISTRLRESKQEYEVLDTNLGRSFQGPIPGGDFYLREGEAEDLLRDGSANYADVVRPYLIGDDITDDPDQAPRRYVIDFADRPLEIAQRYPAALALVRERVKPKRDRNNRKARRERWWRWAEVAAACALRSPRCRATSPVTPKGSAFCSVGNSRVCVRATSPTSSPSTATTRSASSPPSHIRPGRSQRCQRWRSGRATRRHRASRRTHGRPARRPNARVSARSQLGSLPRGRRSPRPNASALRRSTTPSTRARGAPLPTSTASSTPPFSPPTAGRRRFKTIPWSSSAVLPSAMPRSVLTRSTTAHGERTCVSVDAINRACGYAQSHANLDSSVLFSQRVGKP